MLSKDVWLRTIASIGSKGYSYIWWGMFVAILGFILLANLLVIDAQNPTSTPVSIQLASITPEQPIFTPTPTLSSDLATATPRDLVFMEPISEVNVRSSPEITEDNRIGVIRSGERYVVLGRYFNWVQFQYDQVPSGRGWVYNDLIEIIQGDINTVQNLELGETTPTLDPLVAAATETRQAILDQPGGILTITAQSRIIQLPNATTDPDAQQVSPFNETVLPTFTFPANLSMRSTDSPNQTIERDEVLLTDSMSQVNSFSFPPLFAIFGLGFFGILGIIVSIIRG